MSKITIYIFTMKIKIIEISAKFKFLKLLELTLIEKKK